MARRADCGSRRRRRRPAPSLLAAARQSSPRGLIRPSATRLRYQRRRVARSSQVSNSRSRPHPGCHSISGNRPARHQAARRTIAHLLRLLVRRVELLQRLDSCQLRLDATSTRWGDSASSSSSGRRSSLPIGDASPISTSAATARTGDWAAHRSRPAPWRLRPASERVSIGLLYSKSP